MTSEQVSTIITILTIITTALLNAVDRRRKGRISTQDRADIKEQTSDIKEKTNEIHGLVNGRMIETMARIIELENELAEEKKKNIK